MHLGSDSVLTPERSGGNPNRGPVPVITVTLPSLKDFLEGRVRLYDEYEEPTVSVVGLPSRNAEGVQDAATATEMED